MELKANNTISSVYKRFMEHFQYWDEGRMDDKEWEPIRRGFEAQAKILGNFIRIIHCSVNGPNEFRKACISFGILPEDFEKKIGLPEPKKDE